MRMTYKIKRAIEAAIDAAGAVVGDHLFAYADPEMTDHVLAGQIRTAKAVEVEGIVQIDGDDVAAVRRLIFGRLNRPVVGQPLDHSEEIKRLQADVATLRAEFVALRAYVTAPPDPLRLVFGGAKGASVGV